MNEKNYMLMMMVVINSDSHAPALIMIMPQIQSIHMLHSIIHTQKKATTLVKIL